jgi:hypothetical protein
MCDEMVVVSCRCDFWMSAQTLIKRSEESLSAIVKMFPGIFTVEDDWTERIRFSASGKVFHLANKQIGGLPGWVPGGSESDEITQGSVAECAADLFPFVFNAVSFKQAAPVEAS